VPSASCAQYTCDIPWKDLWLLHARMAGPGKCAAPHVSGQWRAFLANLWYNGFARRGPLRPTDVANLFAPCSFVECSIDATRQQDAGLRRVRARLPRLGVQLLVGLTAIVVLLVGLHCLTRTYSRIGDFARALLNLRLWLLVLMVSCFARRATWVHTTLASAGRRRSLPASRDSKASDGNESKQRFDKEEPASLCCLGFLPSVLC
jgi:hypothetical protein